MSAIETAHMGVVAAGVFFAVRQETGVACVRAQSVARRACLASIN